LPVVAALLVAALGLSACSIGSTSTAQPGSLAQNASLKGATFTVGSKEFTEQLILCNITIEALESAGATVHQQCGLNGSTTVRTALTSGSIDMYWEYAGTAWIGYLQHTKPIAGAAAQYQAVAQQDLTQNHIVWLDPAPYNSTYAIVVKSSVAQQLGVKTLSDYAKLVAANPSQASMCAATEFEGRDDGLPGLESTYGFKLASGSLATIAEGAIYNAVAKGNPCNFGEGDTTDGRIKGLGLIALTDDKQFFPIYNPALTVRQSVANANPNLAKVINPIAQALDLATIQQLNADVDINGQQAADVARTWLQSKGFIGK
jgi:osmoprotectant transport system substrate-binding protein